MEEKSNNCYCPNVDEKDVVHNIHKLCGGINPLVSKKIKKKNILIKQNHVKSIKHIMIIEEKVAEHLEKLGQGST